MSPRVMGEVRGRRARPWRADRGSASARRRNREEGRALARPAARPPRLGGERASASAGSSSRREIVAEPVGERAAGREPRHRGVLAREEPRRIPEPRGRGRGSAVSMMMKMVEPYISIMSPASSTPTLSASAAASMVPTMTGVPAASPVSSAARFVTAPAMSVVQASFGQALERNDVRRRAHRSSRARRRR